jgi:integrase
MSRVHAAPVLNSASLPGHLRTVAVLDWLKAAVDDWTVVAGRSNGPIFQCVNKNGSVWGTGISEKVVWAVVKECAANAGNRPVRAADLHRTCARLCHDASGEPEQTQFLLGHVSLQTTEHYPGSAGKG